MREWIVTNGLGGYASLTFENTNTRKFHGLLVASINPPVERQVFVSNVFDRIQFNKKNFDLDQHKCKFTFDLFPIFTYDLDKIKIKKTILMEHGKNTTIIKYEIKTEEPLTVFHKPIINSRHFYDVTLDTSISFNQKLIENGVSLTPDNTKKSLTMLLEDSYYLQLGQWVKFYYQKDLERKETWQDYNIIAGEFQKKIEKSDEYYLIFTLHKELEKTPSEIYLDQIKRKKNLIEQAKLSEKYQKLILSADNFIVNKGNGKSVIAGYHWFSDWGRDTLISLPGLTLVTNRFDDAKQILLGFSKFCKNGLIPNLFTDEKSEPIYNTVDASLWFIDRVYQYMKYTNDRVFLEIIWNTLESIIESYKNGTNYDIFMDNDFLISHGPGLTWMDVKIGDYYPTPRAKKAVEIQALWYNALMIMSKLANFFEKEDVYFDLAKSVKESFVSKYDQQYDVMDTKDLSFRANQLFLVSTEFSMINSSLQKKIVKEIEKKLLTVFGLRTLSSEDPQYLGNYIGNYNRDIAYHNGVVWPWLIGQFIKAYVKINNCSEKSRKHAFNKFIKPMLNVFGENWDGSIHEIYDGEPVYAPRGCIAQAWSVAEILRCCIEDIENISPEYKDVFESHKIRV